MVAAQGSFTHKYARLRNYALMRIIA